jgi:hypothetical protein
MSICYGPGEGYRLVSIGVSDEPASGSIRRKTVVIKERYSRSSVQRDHVLARVVRASLSQIASIFDPRNDLG